MAPSQAEAALAKLTALQSSHPLTIVQLSEPISSTRQSLPAGSGPDESSQRTSDVSATAATGPTPSSLEADLSHYRELFAKLRFSYVEQVTKEKFIRAIVGDPPLIVTPPENVELERENAAAKARLKELKTEVAAMVAELEARGRDLARRYEGVRLATVTLGELPAQVAELEAGIAALRAEREHKGDRGSAEARMALPLERTRTLVDEARERRAELDRRLEQLEAQVPRKRKEADRLAGEVQTLEARRNNVTTAAAEARRRREAALGGAEDDLEQRGRWWRAEEMALRQMLEGEG